MTDDDLPFATHFPQTRYLGSKRKLMPFLSAIFRELSFDNALDPFCGTGAVAYLLKCMGKTVDASDVLETNAVAARALVANSRARLGGQMEALCASLPDEGIAAGFVEETFDGLFFLRDENRFIDQILPRIDAINDPATRDLARWCLVQAALAKRPYNLFHRANLAMRTRSVKRSFGNKATWDTPFPSHMKKYADAADGAIIDTGKNCRAFRSSARDIDPTGYDLVYLDPPYMSAKGTGVDYLDFYHFAEGLCLGAAWKDNILCRYRHLPLRGKGENPWSRPEKIAAEFRATIEHFSQNTLVISYRSDGIPTIAEITQMLRHLGKRVRIVESSPYSYALSTNRTSKEVLLIGE